MNITGQILFDKILLPKHTHTNFNDFFKSMSHKKIEVISAAHPAFTNNNVRISIIKLTLLLKLKLLIYTCLYIERKKIQIKNLRERT